MKDKLIIIGAGGHGKVVSDVARKMNTYKEIYFLDDFVVGNVVGVQVIGKPSDYTKWIAEADYFVAIGDSDIRESFILDLEKEGATLATLVHPNAVIGTNVTIGNGTVIMAGAVVNPDTRLGKGVIVNTSSSIDHDNIIEDFCHISVGSHLAGTVIIGKHTMIGAGATIINNIKICENAVINAGVVVTKNIDKQGTYTRVITERIG